MDSGPGRERLRAFCAVIAHFCVIIAHFARLSGSSRYVFSVKPVFQTFYTIGLLM